MSQNRVDTLVALTKVNERQRSLVQWDENHPNPPMNQLFRQQNAQNKAFYALVELVVALEQRIKDLEDNTCS